MKIDATIKIIKPVNSCVLAVGSMLNIPIDLGYIKDYDQVIRAIEARFVDDYNVCLANNVDYVIVNENYLHSFVR